MTTDRHCLDAETVAAWMDGGLDAAGVAAAEAHASTCERCQALLATVVKTLPVEDPLARRHEARGAARLWRWWLAPIAATAAAVTIWMVVPRTPMQPMQAPTASAPARDMAKAQDSAPAQPFAEVPAAVPPPAAADSRRNAPAAVEETKVTVAVTASEVKLDAQAKDAGAKREENTARPAEARAAVAPIAGADAGERMREASASAPKQSGELRRDLPAAPGVGAITQLRKQIAAPEIVSPDPTSRWRATTAGSVERSEDGGGTWIPVRVVANEDVLAGASPGRLVCWLVGRTGLVLLATDGTNFTRLPFPESVDLVAVSSPEPRIATVTTSDARTFRTEDAGRSWRQQ